MKAFLALIIYLGTINCDATLEVLENLQRSTVELVYAITLSGNIYGISLDDGRVFWVKQGPSIVLVDQKNKKEYIDMRGIFIPNPTDGSLFSFISRNEASPLLKDLSVNIQKLVSLSPLNTPDGILQLGLKKDIWYEFDSETGTTYSTLGLDSHHYVVSLKPKNPLTLSTTHYNLILHNAETKELFYNISFHEYNFEAMDTSTFIYVFLSSHNGFLCAVHKITGYVPWKIRLDSPVVHIFKKFKTLSGKLELYHVSNEYIESLTVGVPDVKNTPNFSSFSNILTHHKDYIYSLKTYVPNSETESEIELMKYNPSPAKLFSLENKIHDLDSSTDTHDTITVFTGYIEFIQNVDNKTSELIPVKEIKWRYIFLSYTVFLTSFVSIISFCIFVYIFPIRYNSFFSRYFPVPKDFYTIGKIHINLKNPLSSNSQHLSEIFEGIFENRNVAVKRIPFEHSGVVRREIEALTVSDGHPNLIRYFCMEEDANFYYIAIELCSYNLYTFVTDKSIDKFGLDSKEILRQSSLGIAYLHNLGIVHRRIKPQNVLISKPSSDGTARIILGDFGFSSPLFDNEFEDPFLAPEIKQNQDYTLASDLFALGLLFYFVLTSGKFLINDKKPKLNPKFFNFPAYFPEVESLILKMVDEIPKNRPTINSIICHVFFWTNKKRCLFLQEFSNYMESLTLGHPHVKRLEKGSIDVIRGSWLFHFPQDMVSLFSTHRSYSHSSVRDFMRAIRNKVLLNINQVTHFNDSPKSLQKFFHDIPLNVLIYCQELFPKLMIHIYTVGLEIEPSLNDSLKKILRSTSDI